MIVRFRKPSRVLLGWLLVAVLLALLVLLARGYWVRTQSADNMADARSAPPVGSGFRLTPAQWATLKIEPVGHRRFDSVLVADGIVTTNDNTTVTVYSPYSGRVTAVQAQLGQTLRKGAPLATLLAIEAAQSDSDLVAAVNAEATAQTQLEVARSTEHRQHELLLAEAGAQKDWLQSQVDLVAAQNAAETARAALRAARARAAILGGDAPKRGSAAGQGLITAPIDGVVVQRQVALGQFVNSLANGGATALFTIANLRTVWVVASVSEVDASALKLGQTMEVTALALPGLVTKAKIAWIAAVVDPVTHRVAVRAEVPNPDLALKPQMTVTVRLFEGAPAVATAIPGSAIVFEGQAAHCYVVVGERALAVRKLQVGRVQDGMAEVSSGLVAGDRVVTRGALFIDRVAEDDTP